ncbi:hypothetical protein IL992_28205 [Microbispora sp. NEAU-D428]|uniref:hypothetical protein n=1 Tax=Microbispora sitophila TaxID=2771537 RepID=UPI0018686EDD|nr:hypothetical protein [Microbispora sitophila]MBE3013038.1 hypothetical protein [Microbispora sitophila]
MSNARVVIVVAVLAPVVSVLLAVTGRLEPAGLSTGLVAGSLLRGEPARAAVATLYGGVAAVVVTLPVAEDFLGQSANAMGSWFGLPGWPGWAAGAVVAYLVAARRVPAGTRPTVGAVGAAALIAAVLACGQLVAAKVFEVTQWVDYHEWDGAGWYRDLTGAFWHPAASVVLASVIAARLPGGRGAFVATPLAAWIGCAITAGPVQYAQALGVESKPAGVALLASLAGGGIGAAAGSVALRHTGAREGLVSFVLLYTANELADVQWKAVHLGSLEPGYLSLALGLIAPAVVVAAVASRTARRDASWSSGLLAGVAGPLLIWSIYVAIGPRPYDHNTQSEPYWFALLATLMALAVAGVAAGLARLGGTTRRPAGREQ